MNEAGFSQALAKAVKRIDPTIYHLKIATAFNNGVPDSWWSGNTGDLWSEQKYLKQLPKRETTIVQIDLSKLQADWITKRHHQGRNMAVIVGSPEGHAIFPGVTWQQPVTKSVFTLSRKDVVLWIVKQVMSVKD